MTNPDEAQKLKALDAINNLKRIEEAPGHLKDEDWAKVIGRYLLHHLDTLKTALASSREDIGAMLERVPVGAHWGLFTTNDGYGFNIYPENNNIIKGEGPTPAAAIRAALECKS